MSRRFILPAKASLAALLLVVAFALSPLCGPVAYAGPALNADPAGLAELARPFTFVVLGDNRTGTDVYARLIREAVKESPSFVLNVGDVVYDGEDAAQWDEFIRLSKTVAAPYFIAPGNHEVHDRETEMTFRARLRQPGNGLYYSFKAGNSLFVVLDSEQPGRKAEIAGRQLAWLKGVLGSSREEFKFVFLHRPLYPGSRGPHSDDCMNMHEKERDDLEALFERYKVTAVFTGHIHRYLMGKKDGVVHFITGGAGAPLAWPEDKGGFYHFIKVVVRDGSVTIDVRGIGGEVRDHLEIAGGAG